MVAGTLGITVESVLSPIIHATQNHITAGVALNKVSATRGLDVVCCVNSFNGKAQHQELAFRAGKCDVPIVTQQDVGPI